MKLIYLVGNMCAGKSTLARNICEVLPHYRHFEIDAYRRKHQAVVMEYEVEAWEDLTEELLACEFAILDTTGVGLRAKELLELTQRIKGAEVLTIVLEVGERDARIRFTERGKGGYVEPPFPYDTTRWESFDRIENKVNAVRGLHMIHTGTQNEDKVLAHSLDLIVAANFH
jgi:hypothetical protein